MVAGLRTATLEEIQRHEARTASNIRFGSYGMDQTCPNFEIEFHHGVLQSEDTRRIYVLPEFCDHTIASSCRIADALPSAAEVACERLAPNSRSKLDLTAREGLELVLFGLDLESGPLLLIDGNHRAFAHFLRFRSLHGVAAYIGIHSDMLFFKFVPPSVRRMFGLPVTPDLIPIRT